MASRIEQLDSARWSQGFLARLDRYATAVARSARPLDAGARESVVAALADAPEEGDPARLRRDAPRARRAPRPRGPDSRDQGPAARPCRPARDERARRQRPHAGSHSTRGSATCRFTCAPSTATSCGQPGGDWETPVEADLSWLARVERLFRRVAADVPGTMVERKTASVSWHYRQAEPEYGSWRARELLVALENVLAGISAEVLPGRRVIEVRARGINKGIVRARGCSRGRKRRARASSSPRGMT